MLAFCRDFEVAVAHPGTIKLDDGRGRGKDLTRRYLIRTQNDRVCYERNIVIPVTRRFHKTWELGYVKTPVNEVVGPTGR